jgi:hypothetical protein
MGKKNLLPGGKGDKKDLSAFDPKEVEMGLLVEMEHTADKDIAREIVTDHLSENPQYYSSLRKAGLADELKKASRNDNTINRAEIRPKLSLSTAQARKLGL